MSDGPAPPDRDARTEAPGPHGWRQRIDAAIEWIKARPLVARGLRILDVYGQASGGLLAAGLSFFALFTIVPALLLMVSLLGYLVADPAQRAEVLESIVSQVPPIEEVARAVLDGLATGAQAGTFVGLVGALWGASGFYASLQDAMHRMFPGPRSRDAISTRVRGVVSVALVIGGLLVVVIAGVSIPLVTSMADLDLGPLTAALTPAVVCVAASAACLVVYLAVPVNAPSFRAAVWPALAAGLAIGLLTAFFGLIAPFMVRNAAALGLLGAVFVALVWFNLVFQLLLYGAALARVRRDEAEQGRAGPAAS